MNANIKYKVYILWSDKLTKRYVGHTSDIDRRVKEHNSGNSKFTKGGVPWKLIYSEQYESKKDAMKREKFLKSGQGRLFLDSIK